MNSLTALPLVGPADGKSSKAFLVNASTTRNEMKLILFILLGLVFLGCATANGKVLVAFLTRRQTGSMIPLLGGLAGLSAALLAPWQFIHQFWWVALLLDAGTAYWLVSLLTFRR